MKKVTVWFLLLAFFLSGCANLGPLIGLGAAGYGIYRTVKNK